MLKYLRRVGGGLAITGLGTLGAYFVTAVTSAGPQPWWPYVFLVGLTALGSILYLVGPQEQPKSLESPPSAQLPTAAVQAITQIAEPAAQPAPPVAIRLMPELDAATNRLRLGALNRGQFGRFRIEVIDAHKQNGDWIGRHTWPVPWLEDGSTGSKDIPMFGKPLLDFAHFDFLRLQEDLEGTQWLNGDHWVFPSQPEPVKFRYSAVRAWQDLSRQYTVVTLRVIRDEPEGHVDVQFKIGLDGTRPYCRELPEKPASGTPMPTDPRQLRDLAVNGRLNQPIEAAAEPEQTDEPSSAVTDRWRATSDGAKVPSLMRLTQTSLSHRGYGARQPQDVPPSVKIGMLVACRPIDLSSSGSELRAKFAAFLNAKPVGDLVRALTCVPSDTSWKNLAGHGPRTLEAALTVGDDPMASVPIASALFLPPTAGEALYGRDGRSATLLLYVEPRTADGAVPPASDLATWHRRFSRSMDITGEFADFLDKDLGLGSFSDPPPQFGVWLQANQPLTVMVDINGLRMLPGSSPSNEFTGWAYADAGGSSIPATARELLTEMCEYKLHLDAFDQTLAALPE